MSRSALVTTRWSKTKPPLSPPATRRSAGSHSFRSGWLNICSARSSRRHRGRDPEPERVEVAVEGVGLALGRLAAPGAGDVDEVGALGRAGCPRRSGRCRAAAPPAGPPRAPAPGRRPRSGRSGSACPRSAGARSRSRWRGSASPRGRPATGAAAGASPILVRTLAGSSTRSIAAGELAVGLVDRGDAEGRGRPDSGRRRSARRRPAARSPPGPAIEAPVSTIGTERASRALRSQPPERIRSSSSRDAGASDPRLDVGVAGREQDEAGLRRARRGAG